MKTDRSELLAYLGSEVLDGIRTAVDQRMEDAVFEERIWGINNAALALLESGVDEQQVIAMLQRYWDLRLSEAKSFVEGNRNNVD